MRERWYADNRDLVKWATLIHIARRAHADTVLQVAFFRPDEDPTLEENGLPVEFPRVVWDHFRDLADVKRLQRTTHVRIAIFRDPFTGLRDLYFQKLWKAMANSSNGRLVLFLDPDTGLVGQHPSRRHVLATELGAVFERLKKDDWLVFYQHRQLF